MCAEEGRKETWRRLADGELPWKALRTRAQVQEGIRAFFRERQFLEVDPPIAQAYPNIDPNIFPVKIADASGEAARFYLHTSPEPAMKKLLAAGSGDIFFLGKVFRDREGSPLHSPEFTLLEWYRVGGDADAVMRDVEALVRTLARTIGGETVVHGGGRRIPVDGPWPRWELDDAFRELLGAGMADEKGLREALDRKGLRPGAGESWEDLFHRACLDVVEPALAGRGACFLTGYPAPLAGMARLRPGRPAVSERFEGFVAGMEVANAFTELNDPLDQRQRFILQQKERKDKDEEQETIDEDFLTAMEYGMPPTGGLGVGIDRLVMLITGQESIREVILFPQLRDKP